MKPVVLVSVFMSMATIFSPSIAHADEPYVLLHTIGNDEAVVAKGLSKSECETRKAEYKAVATKLGTYNEATGYGSIVCLPESWY